MTYGQIRAWHCTETLAQWLKGLDKAVLALLAVAGPGLLAIVVLLLLAVADGLAALGTASLSFTRKLATVGIWQVLTLGILWSLREAILMPSAQAFFAALPVKPAQRLRADLTLCVFSYSLSWLSCVYAIGRAFVTGNILHGLQTLLLVGCFAAFSLIANLLLLYVGKRSALAIIAGLLAFALPASQLWSVVCAVAATTCSGWYLWHACQQPSGLIEHREAANSLWERWALSTGLATLLLAHELRATLLLRVGSVLAMLGLIPLISTFKPDAGLETAGFVIVMAGASIAFYDLPALCRAAASTRLRFIAGQRYFVRRVALFAHGMPLALYLGAFLSAWYLTVATLDATQSLSSKLLAPALFFPAAFLIAMTAATLQYASARWLMPLITFVAAIVMSGFV